MNRAMLDCLQAAPQELTITDVTAWWAVRRSLEAAAADPVALAIADDPAAARWQRDTALVDVAGAARRQRARRAWEHLGASFAADHGQEPVAHGR